MYKAIIFDFFDVIRTDAYKSWLNLHSYKSEGKFLEAVQRQDRGEILTAEFLAILSELTGQDPDEIFDEMQRGAKIDYDVLALAERLREEYKIGLLSNAANGFLRDMLQEHDLEKYFDEIVISGEVGLLKPEPDIFHHILTRMELQPGEVIFIDDSPTNVNGAQAVGIEAILYDANVEKLQKDLTQLGIRL
jgi:putative hydrolase of the HAD superfamily